jgi:hypothetical protein
MKRGVWCLVALLALPACKSKVTEQGVVVRVSNPSNVAGIFRLRVFASNRGSNPITLILPDAARSTPVSFPTDFSLSVPASRSGQVDIAIDGSTRR